MVSLVERFLFAFACFLIFGNAANGAEPKSFRIGTGEIGGVYYPLGQSIARIISDRGRERSCVSPEGCGIPGLTASALSSLGSVENVEGVEGGWMDAGFVQSDIAYWAYTGSGVFDGVKPKSGLRVIASLYPESIHVVVRQWTKIKTLSNLKGHVVALGEEESGTLVDARMLLTAAGIDEKRDIEARYMSPSTATAKLILGQIHGFFAVAGYPETNVKRALERGDGRLLPLTGEGIEAMLRENKFFTRGLIPQGVYGNRKSVPTVNVNALLIVSEIADPGLIYRLTKALWKADARKILDADHPKGKHITIESSLDGIGIPLHDGAVRYYKEIGKWQ